MSKNDALDRLARSVMACRALDARQLQHLLGDPMHVDRERDAAETDKRYAEFLFAQSSPRQSQE